MKAMSKFWTALVVGVAVMAVSTHSWAVPLSNTKLTWSEFTNLVDITAAVGIPFSDKFEFNLGPKGEITSGVFSGKTGTPAEGLYAYIYQIKVYLTPSGKIDEMSIPLLGPGPTPVTLPGPSPITISSFYIAGSDVPNGFFYDRDDDEDGKIDEDDPDDDRDCKIDEDPKDGIDNDDDGKVDEDPPGGIDEDGDGKVDEDPEPRAPSSSTFTPRPPTVSFVWSDPKQIYEGQLSWIIGFFSPVLPTTTVANLSDTGAETKFPLVYTPSPEPSISLLLGAGLLGGVIWSRGRKRMKKA
jgi:hypothetical protein